MDRIVAKSPRMRWLVLLIGALSFVAAGIFILIVDNSSKGAVIGWMSIVFFGRGALVIAWQLFDTRPRLVIDDRGIFDLAGQIWEKVRHVGSHLIVVFIAAAVTAACLTGKELQYAPGAVSHVVEGQRRDLAALVATMEQVAPYTPRVDLVIPGRRANYRLAEQRPTFLVTPPFDDVIMVRLRPGEQKEDRNLRITLQSNSDVSIAANDMVETATTSEPSGLVRVMPSVPLRPGEYAVLSRTNIKKVLPRVKMFEFGVD